MYAKLAHIGLIIIINTDSLKPVYTFFPLDILEIHIIT